MASLSALISLMERRQPMSVEALLQVHEMVVPMAFCGMVFLLMTVMGHW